MAKEKNEMIKVNVHDMYQLLLSECRYGYTRNNHLMPSGAYQKVKKYLPIMLKVNGDCAFRTVQQLCEECISEQLTMQFYNGLDDEYGSRREAIDFIEYLLQWSRDNFGFELNPYNYDQYTDNLKREQKLKYRVYELEGFDENAKVVRELTLEPVSKEDANQLLFEKELGVTQCVMNHIDIKTCQYPIKVVGEVIRIIEPRSHADKIYAIKLING